MAEMAATLGMAEMMSAGASAAATGGIPLPWSGGVGGGGASGMLSAFQGVGTAASAASALFGGAAGFASHRSNASMMRLNADQEFVAAERQALEIERERLKKVGDARVAYGGSGQLVAGASDIEASLAQQAGFETALLRTNAALGAAGKRGQAANEDLKGVASLAKGGFSAAQSGANYALDLRRRG